MIKMDSNGLLDELDLFEKEMEKVPGYDDTGTGKQ